MKILKFDDQKFCKTFELITTERLKHSRSRQDAGETKGAVYTERFGLEFSAS
jgi:hypothetical protein